MAEPPTRIDYWPRSLLLRSRDFIQQGEYQRLAATLLYCREGELHVHTEDAGEMCGRGFLLGPHCRRRGLRLGPTPAWLVDAGVDSLIFQGLRKRLAGRPTLVLDDATLGRLDALDLSSDAPRELHAALLGAIAPTPPTLAWDARTKLVLGRIDAAPLDELTLAELAADAGLSASRLRALVRKDLGCSLSQYRRWAAAWRTGLGWQAGVTLTELAHAAGFHDLAHANHVFNEMFGLSPSRVLDQRRVALQRWP